ncbi:MAG: hypothetical protein D6753_04550 [Planctomycetota bacterium]|nr:MAG: hypothetical protein D6753_04550 [Planctomycetota bacterium]
MAIDTICAGCGRPLRVADEHAGKHARCPSCGQVYRVPAPTESTSALAVATEEQPPRNPGTDDSGARYWLRSDNGTIYGPVDRSVLDRWFRESRVGQKYLVRVGEAGSWAPAAEVVPTDAVAAVCALGQRPGAATAGRPAVAPGDGSDAAGYPKSDPSRFVIVMALVGWLTLLLGCPISLVFAIVATMAGRAALADIEAGIADPKNRSLIKTGYYLGIALLILAAVLIAVTAAVLLAMVAHGLLGL